MKNVSICCVVFLVGRSLCGGDLSADEIDFVANGEPVAVRQIGGVWTPGAGGLRCGGENRFLVAAHTPGAGDFRIVVRLSIERLDGTAASLMIGQNHFGLDGNGKRVFIEGRQFGKTQLLGSSEEHIEPGKPFDIEAIRTGKKLTLKINGRVVHQGEYALDPMAAVALRPWRATMRVTKFSATGDLVPVTDQGVRQIQQDLKQSPSAMTIGAVAIDPADPPEGLVARPELGVLTSRAVRGQVMHESGEMVWVPRATITPNGDYLVLFPHGKGKYYQGREMLAYRSKDRGKTWTGPTVAFDASQSHHGFVPLIPRDSKRIYAFGTQPIPGRVGDRSKGLQENCPIGFRHSDDDGHTWSDVTLIRPTNDPDFTGMSCVRMCESGDGAWLIGSHDGRWGKTAKGPVATRQYVLRSEDLGKTWTLLPGKRPDGWFLERYDRMDEGSLIHLGGSKVLMMTRTAEGHIWETRSDDNGRTWSEPRATSLVHPDAPPMVFHLSDGKTLIAFTHNRYDPRKSHFGKAERNEVWCSLSRDEGHTWSEPRFVFAGITSGGFIHSCSYLDMIADRGELHVFLGRGGQQLLQLTFRETDLATFPTRADLLRAAAVEKVAETITVGGRSIATAATPEGLVLREQLGLLTAVQLDGQVVHVAAKNLFETRATITPGGDFLLMFPDGEHYGGVSKIGKKVNDLVAYRSSDRGKTWTGPTVAFDIPYSQHGFIPLVPRGSKRIYAFGTQPIAEEREGSENCPIGFRYSDDDGHTWSDATLIRPTNDPDFKGMSVMRMTETASGVWLLGSHEADWKAKPIRTRAYVLRSADRGKTWTVHPGPRPGGWFESKHSRLDEPRPIGLSDGKALILGRTCEGHLWAIRSADDGLTWDKPEPTSLIHPDAPPMLFRLADGKTLAALHHNRHTGIHFKSEDRSEIWVSLSRDEGLTWTEPRFLFANALAASKTGRAWHDSQCSYIDAFSDGPTLHLFVPHRWKRALHLTIQQSDLVKLPTREDLARAPSTP